MTSSFTNLLLAARFLGMIERPRDYRNLCENLSGIVQDLIRTQFDTIAALPPPLSGAFYSSQRHQFSAAREAALKMLEMSSGRVTTMCETFLSLRHGPMSSCIRTRWWFVAFLPTRQRALMNWIFCPSWTASS